MSKLAEFLESYASSKTARFHMPGHKGALPPPFDIAAPYDITEISGADSLYFAQGIIAEAESLYAGYYQAATSCISAGGGTLAVQAMLAAFCPPHSAVIAPRGVHQSAVNTMALLDLHPVWLSQRLCGNLPLPVTPAQVEAALALSPKAACVYLTSPDYFGSLCDIAAISKICEKYGVALLVDNAHGPHLAFCGLHPIALGADACCDSLHKTLPALTGAAVLHIAKKAAPHMPPKRAMSVFGSTSPSYLIMLSAAQCIDTIINTSLCNDYRAVFNKVYDMKSALACKGYSFYSGAADPLKLTVDFGAAGMPREAFSRALGQHKIEPEYLSDAICIFMPSPYNTGGDFTALSSLAEGLPPAVLAPAITQPDTAKAVMPLSAAVFAPQTVVALDEAENRVCAAVVCPCPPGIPIVMPGELVEKKIIAALKKYGITSLNVLR